MTGIETRPGTSGDGGLVVVPRQAGPLEPLEGPTGRGDGLDAFVDDMFGESTQEGPGAFDLVLLAGGSAMAAWAWLTGAGGFWVFVGIALVVLGLALPARSALHTYREGSARRARRRAAERGYLLDTTSESTAALVSRYEELLERAAVSGSPLADRTVDAAHGAVVEVATLLDGRPPITDAEIGYVEKRARAIRETAKQLRRTEAEDGGDRSSGTADDETIAARRRRADALIRAREELESTHGMGSVEELDTLHDLLRREGDDVAG